MGTATIHSRSAAVMLGGALLISLTAVPAASASTTIPTVTITSLTSGQTVAGSVEIDATITPVPDAPAQSVEFAVQNLALGTAISQNITLQPGQCDTTCTVSWTADTAQLLPYRTGGAGVPRIEDGPASVSVYVNSAYGDPGATVPVTIDNHRPTLTAAADSVVSGTYVVGTGDQTVDLAVAPRISPTAPGSSTLTSVQLEVPGLPSLPITDFTPSADGSTWTVGADTSAVPEGAYTGAIVATDSNGTVSSPLRVNLLVDHGFTLTLPVGTPDVTGPQLNAPLLAYTYPGISYCAAQPYGATPVRTDILLDGHAWYSAPVASDRVENLGSGTCGIPAATTTTPLLPLGHHTLTYVVTDTTGVQESVSQNVTVALPLASTWPTAPMYVAVGQTVSLAPKVTAPDGFSQLKSWAITLNGTTLASGTYPTQPTLHWTTPAKQTEYGRLTLTTTSDSGLTTTSGFTFTSTWETATFLHASATTVKPNTWVKLTASTWIYYLGTWRQLTTGDATARDQWHYTGSSTWTNGAAVYTSPATPGPANIWVKATRSTCYRVVWTPVIEPNSSTDYLPSTTAPVCVTVKS